MIHKGPPHFPISISAITRIFVVCFLVHLDFAGGTESVLPSLGRPALLGELYDARNESFLGVTVFNDNIPRELITLMDIPQSDIKYFIVSGRSSKLSHLDVSAEIKLEILSGKVKVEGSAAYFSEEKRSGNEVEGFLHYKIRTKREILNILYIAMKPFLKLETLSEISATHCVIGIEYGSDLIIKFSENAQDKEEAMNIKGKLEFAFANPKFSISAAASAEINEKSADTLSNFTMNVYGDLDMGDVMLQNSKQVQEFITKVPGRMKHSNGGKGVPMVYTLFPIPALLKLWEAQVKQEQIINELDEAVLNDFVKMFEKISRVQQDLNDLEDLMKRYRNCTKGEDLARIEKLNSDFSDASLKFKVQVRKAMYIARVKNPEKETATPSTTDLIPTSEPDEEEAPAPEENEDENPEETPSTKPTSSPNEEGTEAPSTDAEPTQETENEEERSERSEVEGRSGSDDDNLAALKSVLEEYIASPFSAANVSARLETDFQAVLKKIELYKVFVSSGFEYFGQFGSFNNLRLKTNDKILYAIFMKEWENSKDWDNNWELFLNTLKRPFSVLAIVDCEFGDATCGSIEKTVTRQYYRQKMISRDVYSDLQQFQDKDLLRVSAVGRFYEIGALYNSISHQFTGKTLLKPGTDLTKLNLTREDYNNETLEILSGGFEEKFTVMDVQPPALQYQILLNPKSLQNIYSGKAFQELEGFDPNWALRTLYHVYNTQHNSIIDAEEEAFDFISISRLTKGGATHFVQKIVYGGQTTISLATPVSGSDQLESSIPTIIKDLEKIQDILSEKSSENDLGSNWNKSLSSSELVLSRNKYQIKFASDIFQNSRGEFRSEKDLTNFLDRYPTLKKRANKGKGHPVLYVLYPIQNLQKYFGVIPEIPKDSTELYSTQTSLEFSRIFESLYHAKGKISQLKTILKENKKYVPDEMLEDFKSLDREFQRFDYNFTKTLRALVNQKSDEKLKTFLDEFRANEFTLKYFNASGPTLKFRALESFSGIQKKIQFFNNYFKEFPLVQFIGREKSLVKELGEFSPNQFIFVLLHKLEWAVTDAQSWVENLHLFKHSLSGKPYNKQVILDCDFNDDQCQNPALQKSVIHLYRDQQLISPDALQNWTVTAEKKTVEVERQSLGRPLKLGQLYNIRKETFLDKSILQQNSNSNSEIQTKKSSPLKIWTKIIPSTDLETRFEMLNVEAELEMALLFQNDNSRTFYDGSGKFLDEKLSFSSAVALTVHFDSISLNLSSPFLPKHFNPSSLFPLGGSRNTDEGPTHYVQEIRLGSNTIVALGETAEEEDVDFLEKNLGKDQNELWSLLRQQDLSSSPPARNESKKTDLELLEDFTIFTDVALDSGLKVIKGGNLKDLTQKISKKSTSEESADSSVSFVLSPLESLQQPLGLLLPPYKYQPFSVQFHSKAREVVHFFYSLILNLNETEILKSEMETAYKFGFSDSSLKQISENLKNLRDFFISFKTEFQSNLESFKNGSKDESKLNATFIEFKRKLNNSEIQEELTHHREKIKFLKIVSKYENVEYLGRDKSFNDFNLKLNGKPKYLLYFRDIRHLAGNPEWTKAIENFFTYLVVEKNECFIVDCDFPFPHCEDQKGGNETREDEHRPFVFVHQYIDGSLNSTDYISQMNLERNQTEEERAKDKILLYNLKEQVESLKKSLSEEEKTIETLRGSLGITAGKIDRQVEDHFQLKNQTLEAFEQEKARIFSLKDDIKSLSSTFEREHNNLRNENEALSKSFTILKKNSVPVGFVYTQFPNQPPPIEIWPHFMWKSVTGEYAGLFFRAEGGGSSSFGQTQKDQTNRITQIDVSEIGCSDNNYKLPSPLSVPESGWSEVGRAGWYIKGHSPSDYNCEGVKVQSSGEETRPRNTAIRIWKRTG